MNRCLKEVQVEQKKDHTDPKRPRKETAPIKYRPITCLPMMFKILTAQITEEIYFSLTSRGLFSEALDNHFTLICTSSMRTKQDGKIWQ